MNKTSSLNDKNMKTLYKLIVLFFTVFMVIPKGYSQNNADPGIAILMSPESVVQGSNGILSANVGNYGNGTIVENSLRITISVGSNAEIIGIASGSDTRWNQLSLTTGSANTIKLTNSGGGFSSFDISAIYLTVRGNATTDNGIAGNIIYITAANPLLCGGCSSPPLNVSQGNASNSNDNSETSLAVTVPVIVAVTDSPSVLPGTNTPSVIGNDTLNGQPVVIGTAPGQVTLTSTPNGPLTMNADGTIAVAANTTVGSYPITYTICEVSNPVNCSSVTSNVIVNSVSVSGSISGATTVCAGTNSTTLTLSGNTGNVQWQSSLDNSNFGDIAGATSSTYTATNLTDTTYYRAVVTNGVWPSATTSSVTMTVSPASVAGSISGAATVCTVTNSTVLTLSGNTGTVQWQSSIDNSTFGDIAGANSLTYTATNLTDSTYYRAVITSGVCSSATTSLGTNSNIVQVIVSSPTSAIVNESSLSNVDGSITKQYILSNSSGFTNYSWSLSNGTTGLYPNQNTVNFTFTQAGYYEVTVTGVNDRGCPSTTIIPVTIASNEVNSGNAGGLESESLGDIMSKQYVLRKMKSIPTEFVKNDAAIFDKSKLVEEPTSVLRSSNQLTMTEMFPANLQTGDVAHITSPTDILNFTIAQEVLSVDYSVQGDTKAVVFGVRTKDKVYNHTKASCDRLKSAEILNVKTIRVGGYNFLIQVIKQRNDVTEYAISFCVGKNYSDTAYTLQSNWYVKEFTTFNDVYNFQVWATLPTQTTKLVNDILNNIKSSMPLVQSEIQKFPKTYASKITREGTELVLKLKSTEVDKSIEITMDQNYSETNGFVQRYNQLTSEINQTIRINVADAYEFDGLIKVEGEIQDAFYHADGNWGLDYDPQYTIINKYRVSNDLQRIPTDDDLLINRNVHLEVFSEDDYAILYKSLLPGQQPADYNDYKFLSFKAKGSGLMELGLIKSSVENWKHQYKAMINIGQQEQTYYVPFRFFTSSQSTENINANDLTMLTFTFLPVEAKTKNLDFTISDVKLTKNAPEGYQNLLYTMQNEFFVYPNPSLGNVKCVLFSDISTTATVSLYDITGKVVYASDVILNAGKNELDFNFNVPKGVLLFSIKNEKINFGQSKIIFK
jgi:carbon monoxide dehydrogenase subunit G